MRLRPCGITSTSMSLSFSLSIYLSLSLRLPLFLPLLSLFPSFSHSPTSISLPNFLSPTHLSFYLSPIPVSFYIFLSLFLPPLSLPFSSLSLSSFPSLLSLFVFLSLPLFFFLTFSLSHPHGHNPVWVQSSVGAIPCGLNPYPTR